jgi:hypothetical protein
MAITNLISYMLSGEPEVGILSESRLVFISKRGSGRFRPLGIGDCWYRFLGRTVVKAIVQITKAHTCHFYSQLHIFPSICNYCNNNSDQILSVLFALNLGYNHQ